MGKIVRLPDWPERLHDLIENRREAVFCWGQRDCCMFAADVMLAMTGVDFAAALRGRYSTAKGAARLLKRHGGVEGVANRHLRQIPKLSAGRGDIVSIDTPDGPALAVCLGRQIAAQGQQGLLFMDMNAALSAWREPVWQQPLSQPLA
jgi:hypothetical protein